MKKVLIVCVNYNSYEQLNEYMNSIVTAKNKINNCFVDVYIADNSIQKNNFLIKNYNNLNVKVYHFENIGYLPGVSAIVNNKIDDINIYEYVIISNVDVLLDELFFIQLFEIEVNNKVGWIAPQIYSRDENRDRNPKIINRLSKIKIQLIKLFYKIPVLFLIYTRTLHNRKRINTLPPRSNIYAGHGSFIILTKHFFKKYKKIFYPVFLFGEELFFAELIKNKNMKVIYEPNVKVYDYDHISTSKLGYRIYCKENYKAIKYIIREFYE